MDTGSFSAFGRRAIWCALATLGVCALQANAQQGDVAEGEQLYTAQCKLCHGNASAAQTSDANPSHWRLVRLAMQDGGGHTRADVSQAMATATQAAPTAIRHEQLAFAPPFGPPLLGVYGRPAGSVEGFQYSTTFLSTLKGMEWNDAALDVWITNTQAWVPGVYMFYKQPDPGIRRKIILYLKANK